MRKKKISEIMDYIDIEYVNEATNYVKLEPSQRSGWRKWGVLAACFAMVILAGVMLLPSIWKSNTSGELVTLEEMNRPYSDSKVAEKINLNYSASIGGLEWPTEYLTLAERCGSLKFHETSYTMHGYADESLIGERIGDGECNIYDSTVQIWDNFIGTEMFEVYELDGVSEELMVAVKIEDKFWLFQNRYREPENFGEWLNIYNLADNLELNYFSMYDEENVKTYFSLEDDSYVLDILLECQDAEYVGNVGNIWNSINFSVTVKKLEMYNKFFRITKDGYIWTDMFAGNKSFFIGEEAAGKIISYVTAQGMETEYEQYEPYSLVGYIEEISEDYILVNDGIMCKNKEGGITFTVSIEDITVRRYVECYNMQVGDFVWIDFREGIDVKADNLVCGVFEIGKAAIRDGSKIIMNNEGYFIQAVTGGE
ncbi:MAG: hypothetical protein IJZ23_02005 [Roseburia sp.]|nr:hypothetical protein [Roseburia sp.]